MTFTDCKMEFHYALLLKQVKQSYFLIFIIFQEIIILHWKHNFKHFY